MFTKQDAIQALLAVTKYRTLELSCDLDIVNIMVARINRETKLADGWNWGFGYDDDGYELDYTTF